MLHEARRHELRLPHRASPRSEHGVAADMALLQDQERSDQLIAKERRAPARLRQRGERADDIPAVTAAAEVGLNPPDRQNEPAIDAVALLDSVKGGGMLRSLAHARLDARLGGEAGNIGTDRLAEFRLPLSDRHDARIGRDAREGHVEGRPGHPFGAGVRPQLLQERRKGRHLRRGRALGAGLAWLGWGWLGSLSRRDLCGRPLHSHRRLRG